MRLFSYSTMLRQRFGGLVFHALRGVERMLPVPCLYSVLKPLARLRVAFERTQILTPWPACLGRPVSSPVLQSLRLNFHLNRVVEFFPDRLATAKWKGRCQVTGLDQVHEATRNGRPVILAFCHFGPFFILPQWFRAQGISLATLVAGGAGDRSRVKRLKDQVSPFPVQPQIFFLDQLREVHEFLASGNRLLIAIDHPTGNQIDVPIRPDWNFRMATGAIRLAARCGAELLPCAIIDEGNWRFRLEIGRPVPQQYLMSPLDLIPAGQHILAELMPHFQRHPEQCFDDLTRCFRRVSPALVPELSLAVS